MEKRKTTLKPILMESRLVGYEKPSLDDLAHFGIRGMHWGVRKDAGGGQSTESKELRKLSKKTASDYVWDSIAKEPLFNTMTKKDYEALSTEGQHFSAGIILKRVEMSKQTQFKGATFVSKLESDANFYRAVLPPMGPSAKGRTTVGAKQYKHDSYEIKLKTLEKLTIPSEKERVDAFMEILKEPSIKIPGKKAPVTGRAFLEKNGYKSLFKKPSDQELAFTAYYDFLSTQGDRKHPLNEPYFAKLKSKGFNATVDDNDRGRYTKNPLILLNPEKSTVTLSVRKLTTDEINQAQRALGKRSDAGITNHREMRR